MSDLTVIIAEIYGESCHCWRCYPPEILAWMLLLLVPRRATARKNGEQRGMEQRWLTCSSLALLLLAGVAVTPVVDSVQLLFA